ncbi:MAG: hypothetical protein GX660_03275 [Clostridiaceae bacterium]|nr:hypothetical protein [Clostridiaceae bacterium]
MVPKQGSYSMFNMKMQNDRPSWIRPVSSGPMGQVDSCLVDKINLLDIIEIEVTEECPSGFQSENVLFDPKSLRVIKKVPAKDIYLNRLVDQKQTLLFNSDSHAISVSDISKLSYSLTFIKPSSWRFVLVDGKHEQTRCIFSYANHTYDLPITDIDFCNDYKKNPLLVEKIMQLYLTISLGMVFEGKHYKLVAGVISY